MAGEGAVLAHATSDAEDRLIKAGEPLAGLQLRSGGSLPGTIAVPSLLETVRKARRYQLKLGRTIAAHDGSETISAFVEVEPRRDGEDGCDIVLRSWQSTAVAPESAEREANRRNAINRHVAELWAMLDPMQNVLAVHADAPDLENLASAMEARMGTPWTDFVTLGTMSHRQPVHWRLLDGAKVSVEGSQRIWTANLVPQATRGGEPAGFELLLVADQPQAESAPSGGAQAPRARRGMVGQDIAPVLRQPIARIIANAESIRTRLAGPLSAEYADYATDIAAAGQHLLGLLDDLATLEVVESADFETAPDPIDLGDVARQAAGILNMRAKEKNIAIDAPHGGDGLGAIAEFRRVLQILLNLIGNAIRYAPEDSQVWVRLEDEDADLARIVVADQGPGLSEAEAEKVFAKFERLGRSGDGGSGLGLYISRRLARAMGGDLHVESAPGQGARFVLTLPRDGSALHASGAVSAGQPD